MLTEYEFWKSIYSTVFLVCSTIGFAIVAWNWSLPSGDLSKISLILAGMDFGVAFFIFFLKVVGVRRD